MHNELTVLHWILQLTSMNVSLCPASMGNALTISMATCAIVLLVLMDWTVKVHWKPSARHIKSDIFFNTISIFKKNTSFEFISSNTCQSENIRTFNYNKSDFIENHALLIDIVTLNIAVQINECESLPCIHGECTDNINSYMCHCSAGYHGLNCEGTWNLC